jgi:hypothetical protein
MLTAKVKITSYLKQDDGSHKRIEFQPGDEVKGLSDHDIAQLKRMGSLTDSDDETKAARADKKATAAANRDFEDAKKAVTAAKASTEVPADAASGQDAK